MTKFKQSGLTVAITSPVISDIQTAQQQAQAADVTKDSRLQLLATANTALAGRNAVNAIQAGQGVTLNGKDGQIATGTDDNGKITSRDANAADQAGGVNLSISIGASQSTSKTTQSSSTAQGSTVAAGKDVNITASGAGKDSDLTVQGSNVTAGNDVNLKADNKVNLLAAQSTSEQHSTNKSISGSIGISIGTSGFGVTVSASGARGNADGSDVTQTNTHVVAGNQVTLESGDDTNLKGAVVSAKQVTAKVGKDLNIESLQDTSKFASKQASIGASVTIGAGAGGSFNASKSTIKSDFASVAEQSGIRAGDDGFDVNVQGNTDLKGGAITSTQAAIDRNNNRFETGTLSTSDIQNQASFSAKSVGISASTGGGGFSPSGTSVGFGKDSGNASSTTQAAISGIAGNKDARTGDKETGIGKIFDADKVQKEINAQVIITQTFGRDAPKVAADFAVSRSKDLEAQAKVAEQAGDTNAAQTLRAEAKQWDEGGIYRITLQAAVGGLGGGASGALGAGATAAAAPLLTELQNNITQQLKDAGASDKVAELAGQAVSLTTAAGIGAVAGGGNVAGIAGGLNVDANNRQMHFNSYLAAKDKCKAASSSTGCQTIERIGGVRSQIVDFLALPESNVAANFGADGKVVSFTVIDKQSNQPLLILEPAEFQAYREAPLATRGQYLLAPQYSLDLGSAIIYGGRGDAQRAFEHLEYVVTSPEYIFTAATGAAGVALSRASALASEANTAKNLANETKVADEADALKRIASNPSGPDLTNKAAGTVLQQQSQKRFDEITNLFDRNAPLSDIVIDGKIITEGINPVNSKTTKILDSQNLTDQQIKNYAQQLAGDVPLQQVAPGVSAAKLADGTTIRLRSVSSSQQQTGARWTVDIDGNPQVGTVTNNRKIELKFR